MITAALLIRMSIAPERRGLGFAKVQRDKAGRRRTGLPDFLREGNAAVDVGQVKQQEPGAVCRECPGLCPPERAHGTRQQHGLS
jgi:hypothetical protein